MALPFLAASTPPAYGLRAGNAALWFRTLSEIAFHRPHRNDAAPPNWNCR